MILSPCPFCGGAAEVDDDSYREKYLNEINGRNREPAARNVWIYCTVCGARGRKIYDREFTGIKDYQREEKLRGKAAIAWNRREKQ